MEDFRPPVPLNFAPPGNNSWLRHWKKEKTTGQKYNVRIIIQECRPNVFDNGNFREFWEPVWEFLTFTTGIPYGPEFSGIYGGNSQEF